MKTKRQYVRATVLALMFSMVGAVAAQVPIEPDEGEVLKRLKANYPATAFTSVTKTPVTGLFEVQMGRNIAYVDAGGRYFLFGHLYDMDSQADLTAQRKASDDTQVGAVVENSKPEASQKISLADLPLADALKVVNGNGARTLVVFSDPLCPYCKRLDAELPALSDTTIYTFLIPILGSNSRAEASALWAKARPDRATDAAVLDRNLALAARYRINATPTLVREDGTVVPGAMPAEQLKAWIASGSTQSASAGAGK